MKDRKFVSFTVIKNQGCYRYLYRNSITIGKDKVFKGKGIEPVKTTEDIANYFFNLAKTNTYFPYSYTDPTIFDVVLFKLNELHNKSKTLGVQIGLVTYLEIFKDFEEGNKIRLVFSEKILNTKTKYGLWGFTQEEADNIIYVTIYGGSASTEFSPDQIAGGGGAIIVV